MSKIKKKISVRFFSIDASNNFFEDFVSIHHSSWVNDNPVRFFNIRDRKHLIKIYSPIEHNEYNAFFFSIVKERTTWQAKALIDGNISGVYTNQGIIGDLYYYLVVPKYKYVLGFTTGPSASVRSVACSLMQQFQKDRLQKINLEPISKESEYANIKEIIEFTEMRFSLTPSIFSTSEDDIPNIFKELKNSPFMANSSKLELTVSDLNDGGFGHEDFLSVIDYLADNECCTSLQIKGKGVNGEKVQLNLNKMNLVYIASINLRENFVDETSAKDILLLALDAQKKLY